MGARPRWGWRGRDLGLVRRLANFDPEQQSRRVEDGEAFSTRYFGLPQGVHIRERATSSQMCVLQPMLRPFSRSAAAIVKRAVSGSWLSFIDRSQTTCNRYCSITFLQACSISGGTSSLVGTLLLHPSSSALSVAKHIDESRFKDRPAARYHGRERRMRP